MKVDNENRNIVLVKRIIKQDALIKLADVHSRFVAKRRDGRRVIMQNCVLIGLDFQKLCFAQAHFLACLFTEANLTGADFSRARLLGSSFESANLTRANFERADLRAVIFDKAILDQTRFDQADLRRSGIIGAHDENDDEVFREIRSSFRNADLNRTNLSNAQLKDVDFTGANLEATNLDGADLRGARFTGAEFKSVNLTNARLHEADMRGASFEDMQVDLAGVKATPVDSIDGFELRKLLAQHEHWVETDGKQGRRADFSEQNLAGLKLAERNLAAVSFANSNLKGVDFRGAVLAACDFSNANLRGANLSHSDLRGADLTGAVLDDAQFDHADIGALPETGMETVFPDGFLLDR